jgi:hypothetical protein
MDGEADFRSKVAATASPDRSRETICRRTVAEYIRGMVIS